ncbi:MAG: hypothetical protein QW035_02900 [Candidatus Anstonellales archaeon]
MGIFWKKNKKEENQKPRRKPFNTFQVSEKIPTEEELKEEFRGLYSFILLERVRARNLSDPAVTKEAIERAREGIENFPSSESSAKHISSSFKLLYEYTEKLPHYLSNADLLAILSCILAYKKHLLSSDNGEEHKKVISLIELILKRMGKLFLERSKDWKLTRRIGQNPDIEKVNKLLSCQLELIPQKSMPTDFNVSKQNLEKVFGALERSAEISAQLLSMPEEELSKDSKGYGESLGLISEIFLRASNAFSRYKISEVIQKHF